MDDLEVLQRVMSEMKFKVEQGIFISAFDKENYITIIDALDKRICRDVVNKQTTYVKFCPACWTALLREDDKYCSDCGQKLKWD